MRRGEIRWFRFKHPDRRRPVLLLTRDSVLDYLGDVTVAPVTSTIRGIPSEVVLSSRDGVPHDCAINCDHIQTVPQSQIGSLIGTLPSDKLRQVRQAILFALDL
ncbi:MAG: type II toxin-antitoxin system PemK/MazF family toxin [Candidatus Hydrogenedentes bacterium]|nr:type II toxin-antitoxin system PemK/MazF family toxin [Candidatus Hydrogenedentota bacterium]